MLAIALKKFQAENKQLRTSLRERVGTTGYWSRKWEELSADYKQFQKDHNERLEEVRRLRTSLRDSENVISMKNGKIDKLNSQLESAEFSAARLQEERAKLCVRIANLKAALGTAAYEMRH